jgi:hypothetical protein
MTGASADSRRLATILIAVIEASREAGEPEVVLDVPLRSRLGTFALRSTEQFKVSNQKTLGVRACRVVRADRDEIVGTVIVKTVAKPEAETGRSLPREVAFYEQLGPRAAMDELRIPILYAFNQKADGAVQLFLEHLRPLVAIEGFDDMCRAAQVMGRFAGHSHAARLYQAEWLPQGVLTPALHQIVAFDSLLNMLPVREDERAEIFESYRQMLDRLVDVNAAHARELPTLCHGDLYRLNLFAWGKGFAAIDWEQVNAGRMGDDLGKLVFQWLRAGDLQAEAVEERLIGAYIEGVAPFVPKNAADSIRRVYRLRSIGVSIGKADLYWRWARQAPDRALRQRRMRLLAQRYRRMALRARQAMHELGT